MKNLLHIAASPRIERSHSRRLAREFIAEVLNRHPNSRLTEFNVGAVEQTRFGAAGASAKFKKNYGQELNQEERGEWENARACFEQWKAADLLVVSTPMWNFSMPYHLKQWIDHVMQPGWSFGFDPAKGYMPLLAGKKAVFICACGGVFSTPEAQSADFLRPYLKLWAGFHGLDFRIVSIEGTNAGGEAMEPSESAARKTLAEIVQSDFCR